MLPDYPQERVGPNDYISPGGNATDYRMSPREIQMAERLVESMSDAWNTAAHHDECCDGLRQAVENRMKSKGIVSIASEDDDMPEIANTRVVDPMSRHLMRGRLCTETFYQPPYTVWRRLQENSSNTDKLPIGEKDMGNTDLPQAGAAHTENSRDTLSGEAQLTEQQRVRAAEFHSKRFRDGSIEEVAERDADHLRVGHADDLAGLVGHVDTGHSPSDAT
ncbi:hypothetical protein PY254_16800 [Rhodanobacter sp. AS-Z3]|uniref:hypothetical protein n=1 Tax=Rhodanobacter sp. AS-Z3 TaxID=3031330 RepID=UPI00247A7695|nr:hypothetical protein [Rhodanobacter sp. AS-Z3]WEN14868.1 hypothetical protein PY254_16800 [Rhodanobacter sp. AS-Z3]